MISLKDFLKNDKGFGDTVERITHKTGIKKVVEKASEAIGQDCGCDKRKDYLNTKLPYGKQK